MYDFNEGLAKVEQLEVLIGSPLLRLSRPLLPHQGMTTKPSAAEPAALLVVGAATIVLGSDRAADRELRAHWSRIRDAFRSEGYRVPDRPLRSQQFRDYRDRVLEGSLPGSWKDEMRDRYLGLAVTLGLFPESDAAWTELPTTGVVTSDGTWFAAASQVTSPKRSRSKYGNPRVVTDADRNNKYDKKGTGYMFCITSVRGDRARQRVVLDVAHAPKSAELDVVIPTALRLRDQLGDRFRCFVFDGAMRGTHHRHLRGAGLLTVNKPAGIRRADQWKLHRDTPVGEGAKVLDLDWGCRCRHLVTVTAGMFWELEEAANGGFRRRRILEVADVRRIPVDDGFRWEMDFTVRCPDGDHTFTCDPNATLRCADGKALLNGGDLRYGSEVNLSETLRIVQPNDDKFRSLYGRRNDSESGNKNAKFDFELGKRARSYTRERHETDLWIYSLLANSLVWEEHRRTVPSVRAVAARHARAA